MKNNVCVSRGRAQQVNVSGQEGEGCVREASVGEGVSRSTEKEGKECRID